MLALLFHKKSKKIITYNNVIFQQDIHCIYKYIPAYPDFQICRKKNNVLEKKKTEHKIIMHETYLEFVLFSILKS